MNVKQVAVIAVVSLLVVIGYGQYQQRRGA